VREALEVMRQGNRNRHQAETKMNRHSSRSHAIFIVTVTNLIDPTRQKFAQLYLVDLAGSERIEKTGVQGQQLDEAKLINTSLLALGQVIHALAHKKSHVPYRDSKLTHLLRNCLGGNARTAVVIAASPHMRHAEETLSALRFGARASLIQNVAIANIAEDPWKLKEMLAKAREEINELQGHCRRLEAQVAAMTVACEVPTLSGVTGRSGEESTLAPSVCMGGAGDSCATGGPLIELIAKRLLVWGVLPSLVCPLTHAIMRDPVCAADGWTYERRAISDYLSRAGRGLPMSPVTGQRLPTRTVVPCNVVAQLVKHYLPDLPPLSICLPFMQRLHIWHVQEILKYLDAPSLARSEMAWSSFLAAASSGRVWELLLAADHPEALPPKTCWEVGGSGAASVEETQGCSRRRYADLARRTARSALGARPPSKGLTLFC